MSPPCRHRLRPLVSLTGLLVCSVLTSHCMKGSGFLEQSDEGSGEAAEKVTVVSTSVDGEVATGAVSASLQETQVVEAAADSSIAGASVAFPPGSLALDTSVSIGPGENFVSDGVVATLDLGTGVSSAANAVAVESSTPMDTLTPFTVSLPLPSQAALTADADPYANLVVVYRLLKVTSGGEFTGVMTRDQLVIEGELVRIATVHFGTYQAVITETTVAASLEQPAPPRRVASKAHFRPGFVSTTFDLAEPDQEGLRGWFHHVSKANVGVGATLSLDVLSKPTSGE